MNIEPRSPIDQDLARLRPAARGRTPAALAGVLARHWRRALIALGLCLALGAGLAFATKAVFVGEALLRIERPAPVGGGLERSTIPSGVVAPTTAMSLLGDEAFFETQYGLMRSRSLAERVAADLRLARDDRFLRRMGAGATPAGGDAADRRERAVIRLLGKRLRIAPVRGAHLAAIRFFAPDPRLAAEIANAFARAFIAMDAERRLAASSRASGYIDAQLAAAAARLTASEQALADYGRREGVAPLPSAQQTQEPGSAPSLTSASLESLNAALAGAQAERIAAEARWREARTAGVAAPEVQGSLAIQQMVQDRAKLAAQYRDRLAVFKPDYPDMKPLKARLDETERQLAGEVADIVASLGARYQAARAAEEGLRARTLVLAGELSSLRQRSIRYALLEHRAESDRFTFDALAQRASALRVAAAEVPADITLVDAAAPADRPLWPRPILTLTVAACLGLALALLLCLEAEGWLAPGGARY